jgi:peptidoglycan hydrolase-like protein with peptidoglycan-binding domain
MIRQVQSILAKYGYDPGPIDGKPGRQTIDAIRRFRAGRGLTVDGRITAPLEDALWELWRTSWWDERMAKDVRQPAPIAPQAPAAPSAKSTAPAEDLSDLDSLD